MYVKSHRFFDDFQAALAANPETSVVHSLAASPRLSDFLEDLDPDLSLDWSAQSFQGMPALREKVVARMGVGLTCNAGDVLITAGAAEANFLAITQLVQPEDEIIVDVPGWPQPLVLGEAIGATVKRLVRREEEAWKFDLDDLAALVTSRTRLIFICNPNNPTGQVLSEDEIQSVVRIADRVGAYVLCDEVYAGLEWDGQPTPRVANYYERGISTGSISKALGMQGLRTGWLICPDPQVVTDAMVLREDSSEIMNIMGEAIADVALRAERYNIAMSKSRAEGWANLDLLDSFVNMRPELTWQRPPAGLVGLVRLNLPIDSDDFAAGLLGEPYRTFIMSGAVYGYPDHVRLGVGGGPEARFEEGLLRMGAYIDTLVAK